MTLAKEHGVQNETDAHGLKLSVKIRQIRVIHVLCHTSYNAKETKSAKQMNAYF